MADNTIRVGAIIDASGIPGGLAATEQALATMRAAYASMKLEVEATAARVKAAHKILDSATAETRDAAEAGKDKIVAAHKELQQSFQSLGAKIEATEIVFKAQAGTYIQAAKGAAQAATANVKLVGSLDGTTAATQRFSSAASTAGDAQTSFQARSEYVNRSVTATFGILERNVAASMAAAAATQNYSAAQTQMGMAMAGAQQVLALAVAQHEKLAAAAAVQAQESLNAAQTTAKSYLGMTAAGYEALAAQVELATGIGMVSGEAISTEAAIQRLVIAQQLLTIAASESGQQELAARGYLQEHGVAAAAVAVSLDQLDVAYQILYGSSVEAAKAAETVVASMAAQAKASYDTATATSSAYLTMNAAAYETEQIQAALAQALFGVDVAAITGLDGIERLIIAQRLLAIAGSEAGQAEQKQIDYIAEHGRAAYATAIATHEYALANDILTLSSKTAAEATERIVLAMREQAVASTNAAAASSKAFLTMTAAGYQAQAEMGQLAGAIFGVGSAEMTAEEMAMRLVVVQQLLNNAIAQGAVEFNAETGAIITNAEATDVLTNSKLRARLSARGLTQEMGGPLSFIMGNLASESSLLQKAFSAAFSTVAIVAVIEIISVLAERVHEFYKKSEEGAERVRGFAIQQNIELNTTVDELERANDKLDNQLAKLTGHYENNLKIMLDDAIIAADSLAKTLEKVNAETYKFLQQEKVSWQERLFLGVGKDDTEGIEKEYGKSGKGGTTAELLNIETRLRENLNQIKKEGGSIDEQNAELSAARLAALNILYDRQFDQAKRLEKLEKPETHVSPGVAAGGGGGAQQPTEDQAKQIELQKVRIADTRSQIAIVEAKYANITKEQSVHAAQVAKDNLGTAKKHAEEQYRLKQEELAFEESQGQVSLERKKQFWEAYVKITDDGSKAVAGVVHSAQMAIGHLNQEIIQKNAAQAHSAAREAAAQIEEAISAGREAANASGGKRSELDYTVQQKSLLEEKTGELGGGSEAEYMALAKIQKELPRLVREAGAEGERELKTTLENQFREWEESGTKTLAQQKAFWAAAVNQATGWEELDYALEKYRDSSRKLVDETKKLGVELQNLAIIEKEQAALRGVDAQREALKTREATRLIPGGNREKVQDLKDQKALDVKQGNIESGAAYEKYEAASTKQFLGEPTDVENIKKTEQAWRDYEKVVRATNLRIEKDNVAIAKQMVVPFQQFFLTIEKGFQKAFSDMLLHGKSFGSGMVQLLGSLEQQAINSFVNIGFAFIAQEIAKLAVKQQVNALIMAGDWVAAENAIAANKASSKQSILARAKSAAIGAWDATVDIPIVGPILAPIAAATTYAAALAFEQGGVMPNETSVAVLHPHEMVLPKPISQGIQNMIANGGGSGSGGNVTHNWNITGGPNASPKDIADQVMGVFTRHARLNHIRV